MVYNFKSIVIFFFLFVIVLKKNNYRLSIVIDSKDDKKIDFVRPI